MKTKVISYILMLIMIFSATSIGSFAQNADEIIPSFEQDLAFLNMLGIADNIDTSDASRSVTRAEFAYLTVNMLGFTSPVATSQLFADVSTSDKYAGEIYAARDLGIVGGTGGSAFMPDDAVTYSAAVKMVVTALGYGKLALAKGGYPTGYLAVAQSIDITDGVGMDFTLGDAIVLISNALRTDIWTYDAIQDGNIVYDTVAGKTLLTENFDLKLISGVVTTAGSYSVNKGYSLTKSMLEADGRMLNCQIENAERYLGHTADVWYDESGNAVAIYPDSINRELCIDAADVLSYADYKITAEQADKEKTYSLDTGYSFVLNGRFFVPDSASFCFENGTLKLIDNDGDGKYDFVVAERIEYFVVTSLNEYEYTVYDNTLSTPKSITFSKYGDIPGVIRLYNCRNNTYVTAGFDDIKKGDVLEVKMSSDTASDANLVNVDIITSNSAVGKVEEIGDDYVVIDGNSYEYTDYFISSQKKIILGQTAEFLISSDGRIVSKTSVTDSFVYGYYLAFAPEKGFQKAMIKLLSEENKVEQYELCDKIKLNGVQMAPSDSRITDELMNGTTPIYQVIKYSLNSDGDIFAIDTAPATVSSTDIPRREEGDNTLTKYAERTEVLYKSTGSIIVPYGSIDQSVNFYVPTAMLNDNAAATYDDSYFVCGDSSRVTNDDTPTVDVYDMNENHVPGAVVIYNMIGGANSAVPPTQYDTSYMVEAVTQAPDADGDNSIKIAVRDINGAMSYVVDHDVYQEYLRAGTIPERGDLIRFTLDGKSQIVGIAIDCAYDETAKTFTINYGQSGLSNNIRERYTLAAGNVVSLGDGLLTLRATNLGTGGTLPLNNGKISYYCNASQAVLYSGDRNMIRVVPIGDIISEASVGAGVSDTVVLRSTFFSVSTVFVYRDE